MSNYKYKQSFYNINLIKESYMLDTKEDVTPVYNTLRGKFGYIPKDIDYDNPPQNLVKEGFIVHKNLDEPECYKQGQAQAFQMEHFEQMNLLITVSTRCNYHCAYCFQGTHTNGVDMNEDTIADTIAYIKKAIDTNNVLKKLIVTFFGGEPLLNMNAIRKISRFLLEYTKDKGITYYGTMDTNGFYMTPEVSKELKELGVKKVQIAFDGFETFYAGVRKAPLTSFNRVIANIENSAVEVLIRVNVTKKNKDEVLDLIEYLYSLNAVKEGRATVSIMRVALYTDNPNYDFTDKEWIEFRNTFTKFFKYDSPEKFFPLSKACYISCLMMIKQNVAIGVDGLLYRCDRQVGIKDKAIGTLKDGIIESCDVEKEFRSSILDKDCLQCKYLPICTGGLCRYETLKQGKNCDFIKSSFRQNMQVYLDYVGSI